MKKFDPSAPGVKNGSYFGFPYNLDEAEIVIYPVELDMTASYKDGAAKGPKAVLEASVQLDFYDFEFLEAWNTKITTAKPDPSIEQNNNTGRIVAKQVIDFLEANKKSKLQTKDLLQTANDFGKMILMAVKRDCYRLLELGKKVVLLGGDHSAPLGYIHALAEKHESFGILHIDAHSDLREAYQGFEYSHASIMFNALKLKQVKKIVQVALRDISNQEAELIEKDSRLEFFSDHTLSKAEFGGKSWAWQCKKIIKKLPQKVYVSFDIDGLEPSLCPNTGTPVPGGLSFNKAVHLLRQLKKSGKEIIGCDLNEVAPDRLNPDNDWDANVGARLLWQLCLLISTKNKI